ncbi:MAG: NAD(P)/FAD-dependent oxidoreductase [Pirellulaceae bacterium]|nr:NAD(P)/FAD-dependent oxidoreductase [Pirellulaceae bacterium]
MQWDVVVIGAGAAGLLAASCAASRGQRTLLLEKNRKPGVKILMSGGTRCNLTQATDRRGIVRAFGDQGSFLHSALAALGPNELVELFHAEGVPTKVEATGKIFPASDRALDVQRALLRRLGASGAELALDEGVAALQPTAAGFDLRTSRRTLTAAKVILTTGGQSYPGCGTTGDGYAWARHCGHSIITPRPALVPLCSELDWVRQLQGITVPDVRVRLRAGGNGSRPLLAERRGSFLFTHFGLSGPAVMDVSREVTARLGQESLALVCDFLPEQSEEQVLARLRAAEGKMQVARILADWLPRRLVDALLAVAGVPLERKLAELSRAERQSLLRGLKASDVPLHGSLGFKKAEVTAGGVSPREVDSRTMQSKLVPNLYLAGEILDLDGPIGGYNFQAAFSTGWLAGHRV